MNQMTKKQQDGAAAELLVKELLSKYGPSLAALIRQQMNAADNTDLAEVLTFKQLEPYTGGLKRSAIAELEKRGKFPSPIKLGERRRAWLKSEVVAWQQGRIAAARKLGAR